jgi:heme/copper-type cytochrome/quinol oxidase subunit 2
MFSRIVLLLPLLALTPASPGAARAAQSQGPRVIEIFAERFEFWPSEVTVAEGEEVELRLRSDDTIHGFRIIGTGTNLAIPKRGKGVATARFIGAVPGRYTFECNRMCGAGHNFMRGVLIVRPSSTGSAP